MKKLFKLMAGVACALLVGTVVAEDNAETAWLLITPEVEMLPNKYGEDVPNVKGYSTNEYYNIKKAVQEAKSGSTILLCHDSSLPQNPVLINTNKIVSIDLNGHMLSPGTFQGGRPIVFQNPSNAVLSIANGSISGDLQFYTQENKGGQKGQSRPRPVTEKNMIPER